MLGARAHRWVAREPVLWIGSHAAEPMLGSMTSPSPSRRALLALHAA